MNEEFFVQLEKFKGLNQLFIAYAGLLEDEKDDQDVHAMNVLLNGYSEVRTTLTKICDYYVQQNNKALELYVAQHAKGNNQ